MSFLPLLCTHPYTKKRRTQQRISRVTHLEPFEPTGTIQGQPPSVSSGCLRYPKVKTRVFHSHRAARNQSGCFENGRATLIRQSFLLKVTTSNRASLGDVRRRKLICLIIAAWRGKAKEISIDKRGPPVQIVVYFDTEISPYS